MIAISFVLIRAGKDLFIPLAIALILANFPSKKWGAVLLSKDGSIRLQGCRASFPRFSSGTGNVKREAVPANKRIEQMCITMR